MSDRLQGFLEGLGVPPGDMSLFVQAFTHPSCGEPHYERLEFLGDAVLKLAISEWLYREHPEWGEGVMTQVRAHLVADRTLAAIALHQDLGRHLKLDAGEMASGGRTKRGNLACTLEALIGAVYLRDGFEPASALVRSWFAGPLAEAAKAPGSENAKARLQELTQDRFGSLPVYQVVGGEGPQHQHVFFVDVAVQGTVMGHGRGGSKKEAEQGAAAEALARLERKTP